MNDTASQILELIRLNTSTLPEDVAQALEKAAAASGSSGTVLRALVDNAALSCGRSSPMCQDTGWLSFFFTVPPGCDCAALQSAAEQAVSEATAAGYLRRNTIDSITGKSIDSNAVVGMVPVCHFTTDAGASKIKVSLLQKGGGSENMSRQFSLPDMSIGAGRDLDGVRKCLLNAVNDAQGYGCAPGVIGVCIGGDRAEGMLVAKEQLLRRLDDRSPDAQLAELEDTVLRQANGLGIGPMGLGGSPTLLGVKIAARPRLPASFFVSVAYCCWACRRHTVELS